MSFAGVYKQQGLPADAFFACPIMYMGFITVGYSRREKPKRQIGALGGKSQFCENLEVTGDFLAEAALRSSSYCEELA